MSRRVLLLDVMGTLVHEPFYQDVPAFFGMTLKELLPQLQPGAWVEFEKNLIGEDEFLARFFKDRRPYDHAGLKECMKESYRFLDGVEPLLSELKDRGVEMHTLSNYPIWYRLIEEKLGLSRYVPWTFVSCEMGVRKPDPEAYRIPARKLGVPPADCVFVDDREPNCAAAREVGMTAVCFAGAGALRDELARLGLLESS